MALLAAVMPALLGAGQAPAPPARDERRAAPAQDIRQYVEHIREGAHFVVESSFLRWMTLSTLLVTTVLTLLQFQTSEVLVAQLRSVAQIASFLGLLTGVANLLLLPIQLLVLSRLIGRIGLGNAHLIFPGTILPVSILLLVPTLPSAALAYVGRTSFFYGIGALIDSLLYNAVPHALKARARAFIGGLITPLGSLVGGGLLLLLQALSLVALVPWLIVALAVAYLSSAMAVRARYGQALVEMLRRDDFSFLLTQNVGRLAAADPATLQTLTQRLDRGGSAEMTIFLATLISQIGGPQAVPILVRALRAQADPRVRAALVAILALDELRSAELRQLYTELLADPHEPVRLAAVQALEHLLGPDSAEYLAAVHPLLDDPATALRACVLPAYLHAREWAYREQGQQRLEALLGSDDPEQRVLGVRALGQAAEASGLARLLAWVDDPADAVRLEAALALEALVMRGDGQQLMPAVATHMRPLAHDPVERVRQAALVVLGQLGDLQSQPVLITALSDPSPQLREIAVEMLLRAGSGVVPLLVAEHTLAPPDQRKMAAVVLSRIDRAQFGGLITTYIYDTLITIYRNAGYLEALTPCATSASGAVLCSTLSEQNDRLLDEIIFLLGAISAPGSMPLISAALRSADPNTRATAAEALEALTTPQTASLVAALCDPEITLAHKVQISVETWAAARPSMAEALRLIAADPQHPWLRAVALVVLAEIGATRTPPLAAALRSTPVVAPSEIDEVLAQARQDVSTEVQAALGAALRLLQASDHDHLLPAQGGALSTVEKVLFLKGVPFFQSMTIEQLKVLASACEEARYTSSESIFAQGDPGGRVYVIVRGRVGIEQEKRPGTFVRLATLAACSYFGETSLFDASPRTASAIALQETLTLCLSREPLINLARQYPDLSLKLIAVLSQRLRETNTRIAELTRTRPRKLQRLFEQL